MSMLVKHRRKRTEAPYVAAGSRHVRVATDGRLILFANRSRRDAWLRSQTGRVVKSKHWRLFVAIGLYKGLTEES